MASMKEAKNLPQPTWHSEQVPLKNFQHRHEVPTVAKVVKGQFMNIGTSKFSPLRKLHQDVLVHSVKSGLKILGHSVMRVEARDGRTPRLVSLEQRLSIPVTYKGWFELLSEDGRSVKPIDNVQQLAKLYPEISQVLVRQNVKAFMLNDDGKMTFDKTKVVIAGEQLKLTGFVNMIAQSNADKKMKLLKCTDSKETQLYLSFEQKGSFTPIAGPTDVMGVFNIKDIIKRFRLPLTVKLIQGVWPKVDTSRFTGIVRLDWAYTDEIGFVCPLDRNTPRIYPIPTDVNIKLTAATNNNELKENEAFTNIMVKCNRMVNNYHNTIHLIISIPEGAVKARSHTFANMYSEAKPEWSQENVSPMKRSKSKEDILNEELDDLYGYLREGKQPPPGKFTRDSDEETYYEEPEFEPIQDFRSRLALLNSGRGDESQRHTRYHFVDPRQGMMSSEHVIVRKTVTNGHVKKAAPAPPELPPRQYKRADSAPVIQSLHPFKPTVTNQGSGSGTGSGKGSGGRDTKSQQVALQRQKSKESISVSKISKDSKSSSENKKDGKDSKSSKSGSSKGVRSRKSMPVLYL